MKQDLPSSELDRLRATICANTERIADVPFLEALLQLQTAWFLQAERHRPARDRPGVRRPHLPRIVAWLCVWTYLSG